ncbi:hypothetical protein [Pseudomonas sp. Irchel 3H7]|uniref:hypothetical protein n=1 Tax=Pseudomonas sp. Irchel 3H7 TaxID=2009042 RepID=UPI001140874B|nr:hypothetical protein [Pseudomonas sp. Irchel 3H7]
MSGLINGDKVPLFSASDLISLGIVIQISILAEIRYNEEHEVEWKKAAVGLSVLAVIFYAVLYAFSLLADVYQDINSKAILVASAVMAFGSFAICWAVFDRVTYLSAVTQEVSG